MGCNVLHICIAKLLESIGVLAPSAVLLIKGCYYGLCRLWSSASLHSLWQIVRNSFRMVSWIQTLFAEPTEHPSSVGLGKQFEPGSKNLRAPKYKIPRAAVKHHCESFICPLQLSWCSCVSPIRASPCSQGWAGVQLGAGAFWCWVHWSNEAMGAVCHQRWWTRKTSSWGSLWSMLTHKICKLHSKYLNLS